MKKFLTLLLLISTIASFAQITYQPGYFLNNNGIKTECLIKNVAWKNNPVEFSYKLSETDEAQKGYINSVSEFSVSGYKFKRFTTKLDRSGRDIATMSELREPTWVNETLFLNVLVEGKATLYQYEDGNLVRFFTSTSNDNEAQQLVYKPYKESDMQIGYNNQFRGQLYSVMKDEFPDLKRFSNLKYEKDVLVNLFTDYNAKKGELVNNINDKKNKSSINFKITAGVAFNSVSAKQSFTYRESSSDFSTKASLRVGAEVEVILPFNNSKWAVFANPGYQHYKDSYDKVDSWQVDYTFVDVPLGVRHYMYVSKKSKIFLNAAYVLAFNVNKSNINTVYRGNSWPVPLSADLKNAPNVAVGVGFSHGNFSLEGRYGLKRQLSRNQILWSVDYTSLNIILGYKIL